MESKGLSPMAKALLGAVVTFVVLLAIDYVRDVFIQKGAFSPNWIMNCGLAILVAVLSMVGPDASQRRQNRQNLKNKFSKK